MKFESIAPFWSVVIPLYNKQEFIAATVRSVLNQVGEDAFEVVVIDDGSVDAGPARVTAIADPRVRLVCQSNGGVSAARNRGISESRGVWIAFLDADDLWHPEALSSYRKLILAFPDAEAVAGRYVRVPTDEADKFRFSPHPRHATQRPIRDLPADILQSGMQFCSSSIAVRRSLFCRFSPWFAEGESMGEDLDLWIRIAELVKIGHTDDLIALYRTALSDSLMSKYQDLILLPAWIRLRQRALSGSMPLALRSSSLRLVAEMEVTLARRLAVAGHREAWRHLISGRVAAKGYRWWVTAFAMLLRWKSLLIPKGNRT